MPLRPVDISSGYTPSLDSASDGTQALVNWRMVKSASERGAVNVPRPALSAAGVVGLTYPIIGAYRFQTNLIVVTSDRYIYRIPESGPTIAIPLSTSTASTQLDGTARPTFAEDSSTVFIAGGGYISRWEVGMPSPTQITAGSAPTRVTHVACIGQRVIANNRATQTTKDEFFWSDLGDGSDGTWGALSYAVAEARPDDVLAVYENTAEAFVFGESTLQVYQTGGDALNPFEPVNTLNLGLGAAYSPVQLDTAFAMITDDGRVVRTDGRTVEKLPGGAEHLIRSFSTYADAWGWRERVNQHDLLVFHFPTASRTLEFDLDAGTWSERKVYDAGLNSDFAVGAYAYWPTLRQHWFGSSASAAFYVTSATATTDYTGYPVMCERVTGRHDHGTAKRKRSSRIRAVLKRGTAGPSATPGVLEVRVDDDGVLSEWDQVSIGNDGDTIQTRDLFLSGVFYTRAYHIRYAGESQTALVALYDDVQELQT